MEYRLEIIVYPSEDGEGGRFTAHCLNMDVIADDDTIEGAISGLIETIEAQIEASTKYQAHPFQDAPRKYWDMFSRAERLAPELLERVCRNANKRQSTPHVDVDKCDLRKIPNLEPA